MGRVSRVIWRLAVFCWHETDLLDISGEPSMYFSACSWFLTSLGHALTVRWCSSWPHLQIWNVFLVLEGWHVRWNSSHYEGVLSLSQSTGDEQTSWREWEQARVSCCMGEQLKDSGPWGFWNSVHCCKEECWVCFASLKFTFKKWRGSFHIKFLFSF